MPENNGPLPFLSGIKNAFDTLKSWFAALFSAVARVINNVRPTAMAATLLLTVVIAISLIITQSIALFWQVPIITNALEQVIQGVKLLTILALGVSVLIVISFATTFVVAFLSNLIAQQKLEEALTNAKIVAVEKIKESIPNDPLRALSELNKIGAGIDRGVSLPEPSEPSSE